MLFLFWRGREILSGGRRGMRLPPLDFMLARSLLKSRRPQVAAIINKGKQPWKTKQHCTQFIQPSVRGEARDSLSGQSPSRMHDRR